MTERVTLLVDGRRFEAWSELEITLSLDTFATCSFRAPFEPERREFRETFRPFSFAPLKILIGDKPLFTGMVVGIMPQISADSREVEVTGASLPVVLDDCNAPTTALPLEFKKVGLDEILRALAGPFGIGIDMRAPVGAKFKKVKLEVEDKVFAFMAELAKQRNVVLSSTPEGLLLCWQSVKVDDPARPPVMTIAEGESPLTSITPQFNPQDYFSQVSGFGTKKRGTKGSKHTEQNPFPVGFLRPMSFKLDDTDPADVPEATRAKLGRMFANIASWTIDAMPTWRDPQGELWAPNTTIKITAGSAMIYRRSELLIRNVTLRQSGQDSGDESATLEVVLPGAFSGESPTFCPWQEPV